MTEKMNIEELKVLIANQIKNENLQDILDSVNIEEIAKNIFNKHKKESAQNMIPDIIPEQIEFPSSMPTDTNSEPEAKYSDANNNLDSFGTGITNSPTQLDQSTSGNIPAYTPGLPSFMDKIEPGKVIVFDMNELSQGGENLSHTPLRTFENPDVKKSINDLWLEKGQKKAEVFIVKLEKIGELDFNYVNGTTQFIEKRFDPDFEVLSKYKENPYMAQDAIKKVEGESNIMNQISTAVDLENVVKNIVMDLIQKGMTTDLPQKNYNYNQPQGNQPIEESSPVRAIFRGDGDIEELNNVFDLNMAKLIDDNGPYIKSELPDSLKEYIEGGNREFLKNENQEVEEWEFNDTSYFLPKNRISKNKGYILKLN